MKTSYSEITPYIRELAEQSCRNNHIQPEMYAEHNVNRGLRDMNGNGVVTGLTEISYIKAKEKLSDGTAVPCQGQLYYRGINIRDDISVANVLRQSMQLIAMFPLLAVYSYQSFQHYHQGKSLFIHLPEPELSTAENLLHILRENGEYTHLEASILDLALVLHAEHGGGNNSTFTTHVVTSSGTDTYSSVAAALGSLKGPRHGGANIKVVRMFEDMQNSINTENKDEIKDYLVRLLDKQAFDKAGLIYGMGHAVYSKSDPRADILMNCARKLALEKGFEKEYTLYETVAKLAPEIIADKRKMYKGVSANVDFYSGLIYKMLELPCELFTPIFAVSRIAGWSAHRIEEIQNSGKIIRPTYINVKPVREYVSLEERR